MTVSNAGFTIICCFPRLYHNYYKEDFILPRRIARRGNARLVNLYSLMLQTGSWYGMAVVTDSQVLKGTRKVYSCMTAMLTHPSDPTCITQTSECSLFYKVSPAKYCKNCTGLGLKLFFILMPPIPVPFLAQDIDICTLLYYKSQRLFQFRPEEIAHTITRHLL